MTMTSRRELLKTLGAASTLPAGLMHCGTSQQADRAPNVVYIIIDEIGYYELSCLGHPQHRTPNMDRAAAEGMRFTQALAGGPVCAPTRSCLLTGQHLGHTSVRDNPGGTALRADDYTLGEMFKQAGYATGGFGKWGCGDRGTTGVPERHGFDTFFGYYHQVHAHSYYPNYLIRSGEKVPLEGNTGDFYTGQQYSHYLIFDAAEQFIRQHKDQPFFCYLPWTPPHGRFAIPENDPAWQLFKDATWAREHKNEREILTYAAMVNMIDRHVGQIFSLLQELQLDDQTIVFISGDNGQGNYFDNFFKPNGPFRGSKGWLYEGGLRIPMIVRWPGHIAAGAVSDHLWYFPDVMPTLAELTGVKPPEHIDGISILPALIGAETAGHAQAMHEYLYWEFLGQQAVRMGNWKAIQPVRKRPGMANSQEGLPWELYDLNTDIGEQQDVAGRQPDILQQMQTFARAAHQENQPGDYLPGGKSLGFQGHEAR